MVYYTGDIHGQPNRIILFALRNILTEKDVIVILGDVGANYFGDERDIPCKAALSRIKSTIFCIHGNHERRPHTIPSYKTKKWNGGTVWYEDAYENILFAKDGDIYDLEGLRHFVIGGAYSVDKYYRQEFGYQWFSDEQPSDEIKAYVEQQIAEKIFEVVLSHTCPYRYRPTEAFLPSIKQQTVDESTEMWLETIESRIQYIAWLCGHWHINKRIDKMHFLADAFKSIDMIMPKEKS